MNIKKSILVAGAVAGVGLAGINGLGVVSAATSTPQDSIIDRIASKFDLNKDEVEAVFEEYKSEREQERQQNVEERLTQAVEDGKITEEQKAKILAKLEELKSAREDWKSKTPEERKEAKEELHSSLKQWAEDNGVPLEYLMFQHGHHHGPGMHKLMME